MVPWTVVAEAIPKYRERVEARIAQFGERHPTIRTEYWLEELDGEEGLFPPHRLAQMQGDHPRRHRAEPGRRYALLIDVAGEDEGGGSAEDFASGSRRDSTALTVVEVDAGTGAVAGLSGGRSDALDGERSTRCCGTSWPIWPGMSGGRSGS